jgi:hypothetical protein
LSKIAENCDHNIDPKSEGFDDLVAVEQTRVARWFVFKPKLPILGKFWRAFE